jgi:hypothetical protein
VFDVNKRHVVQLDYPVAGIVIAVTEEDAIPSYSVKFGSPSVIWFDNPSLAAKWSEKAEVGFLLEELFKRADATATERRKTVSCGSSGADCLTPPFFGKVGLNHHAPSHADDGFVGSFSDTIVLRGVGQRDVVLDTRILEVVGEGAITELSSSIRDKTTYWETDLAFKEDLEVEDCRGGIIFLLQKSDADVSSVLID